MTLNLLRRTIYLKKDGLMTNSNGVFHRLLSSEIDASTTQGQDDTLRYYRTEENDPLVHDQRHLGRLYTVSEPKASLKRLKV